MGNRGAVSVAHVPSGSRLPLKIRFGFPRVAPALVWQETEFIRFLPPA